MPSSAKFRHRRTFLRTYRLLILIFYSDSIQLKFRFEVNKKSNNNKQGLQEFKKIPDVTMFTISKISSERSVELLHKAGFDVNIEQAEEIMEFLYLLTEITLKEFFSKTDIS